MTQQQMKNAGYQLIQNAADAKCFTAPRKQKMIRDYKTAVDAHEEVNATLIHLIALSTIENA